MSANTTCVSCACGAEYERTKARLPIKDIGIYECHYCGARIEQWHGNVVPVFRVLNAPKAKDSSAA